MGGASAVTGGHDLGIQGQAAQTDDSKPMATEEEEVIGII